MTLGAVLFDLDGTIIDSAPVITELLALTAEEITGEKHDAVDMLKYVGPPLTWSMGDMGAREDDIPHYIAYYRSHYDKVMVDSPVFAGMEELLRTVASKVPIALATSKKLSGATLTLKEKGLYDLFTVVCGGSEDGLSAKKADIVADALHGLGDIDGEIVMVGDRVYDIDGAAANGLNTIVVSWGAGGEEERERAWRYVNTPKELEDLLMSI